MSSPRLARATPRIFDHLIFLIESFQHLFIAIRVAPRCKVGKSEPKNKISKNLEFSQVDSTGCFKKNLKLRKFIFKLLTELVLVSF